MPSKEFLDLGIRNGIALINISRDQDPVNAGEFVRDLSDNEIKGALLFVAKLTSYRMSADECDAFVEEYLSEIGNSG